MGPAQAKDFQYEIFYSTNSDGSSPSESKYAKEGKSVTFENVKYDTYTFFLKIWVNENRNALLDTFKVEKTVSASDHTVNFPDRSYSKYSNWYFVKTTEELTSAINEISSSNDYSSEKKAVICLTDIVEMSGWNTAISSISEKCTLEKNGFKIVEKRFEVTVSPSITGGTVTAIPTGGEAGDTITLTVEPSAHYKLESISYTDGSTTSSPILNEATGKYTFTMPNHDVTVTPVFKLYYTVTFQDYNGEQVGDSHGYFEGDELTFDDAKAILADSVPTGRQIVAFKNTTSSPVSVYKKEGEGGFPITFNSSDFNSSDVTLRACLDFTHSRSDFGYASIYNSLDQQNGTDSYPYQMNYYGNNTNKCNQIEIEISDNTCVNSALTIVPEDPEKVNTIFDITPTDNKFLIKIKSGLEKSNWYIGQLKLTVTDSATGVAKDFYVQVKKNFGSKYSLENLEVGDIVFNDNTASPYTDFSSEAMTADQVAAAVAVIFDVSGSNPKGVGLRQGTGAWAANGTAGYNTNISTLVATKDSGTNATDAVFSGATDGSGSLATLQSTVSDYSATNYPAWDFVENYATTVGLTGTYASGWYMPSIAELCKLYQAKDIVNNSLNKITDAMQMSSSIYWSSSQYGSGSGFAWNVDFGTGNPLNNYKRYEESVCVIRKF